MGSYKTNPYTQAKVYSSFKVMEMIQGILDLKFSIRGIFFFLGGGRGGGGGGGKGIF